MAKLSALDVYAALMTSLTEEDMKELFKLRSGMTVDEMVQKIQQGFAEGDLKTVNSEQ